MATRVRTTINYGHIMEMNVRVDGMVNRYVTEFTRDIVRFAKEEIEFGSQARYSGYRRTGRLARSLDHEKRWANQYGVSRAVTAGGNGVDYAGFVHEGTKGGGAGWIISRRGGRFGGRFPVGRSQGRTTVLKGRVRGQRANPFLIKARDLAMLVHGL